MATAAVRPGTHSLSWPGARAAEALHAWRRWLPEVPDAVSTVARLKRYVLGGTTVELEAGIPFGDAILALEPEPAPLAEPALRETSGTILLDALTPAAVDALVAASERSPFLSLEVWRLIGGAGFAVVAVGPIATAREAVVFQIHVEQLRRALLRSQ